jgi:hypothetical protein
VGGERGEENMRTQPLVRRAFLTGIIPSSEDGRSRQGCSGFTFSSFSFPHDDTIRVFSSSVMLCLSTTLCCVGLASSRCTSTLLIFRRHMWIQLWVRRLTSHS